MTENELREHVEGLWRCGYSADEIAEELGRELVNPRMWIKRLRERGWDLPIRDHTVRAV